MPLPWSATPTGPNGVASAMVLSAMSSAKLGSWNGLLLGGGSNLSTWPQLTLPLTSGRAAGRRGHKCDNFEAAVPLEPHLDDRVAGDEIGPLGIADDEVVHLLGAQADAVESVAGGDAAPLELAFEEMRGDRPPLDPDQRR